MRFGFPRLRSKDYCDLQFAIVFPPIAFSVSGLFQTVSDAISSAVMGDEHMIQFTCLVVLLGVFLLWWRK